MQAQARADSPAAATGAVPLMRVGGVLPVVVFLRRIGASVGPLLSRASLPPWILDNPEALIPACQAFRFMEDAARAEGIEDLGELVARDVPIETLGLFGRLIRGARTVDDAISTAIRAMPSFSSGARLRLSRQGEQVRLHHEIVPGLDGCHAQADQYWSMLGVSVLRLAAGPRARLDRGTTALAFPQSLLSRPLVPARLTRQTDDWDVEAWRASGPAHDFPGSVAQVIGTLSSPQSPRIAEAAEAIGMSVRALQRRLAAEGVSYEGLVAQSRLRSAVHLLERTDATILDIALDLGYSDHAHFTRAFRRWMGVPPREFRQRTRHARAAAPTIAAARGKRAAAGAVASPHQQRHVVRARSLPSARDDRSATTERALATPRVRPSASVAFSARATRPAETWIAAR